MKNLTFETHRYAPELNKVFLNGLPLEVTLSHKANHAPTRENLVRSVRESAKFSKGKGVVRIARIKKIYADEKHKWLDQTVCGSFTDMSQVMGFIDKYYETESVLLDGSILPEPKIMISFGKDGTLHDVTKIARNRLMQGRSSKPKPLQFS